MFRKELVERPLETARRFLGILDQMEKAYDPHAHKDMRWIYRDKKTMQRWFSQLEITESTEELNDLWREVQDISHILDCGIADELGAQYRLLRSRFFEDMEVAVAEARCAK